MAAFFSATMRVSLRETATARVARLGSLLTRVGFALAIPLLLYVVFATSQKALDAYRMGQTASALQAEIVALRDENLRLQQEIEEARSDVAVEAIARETLGLVKSGDHAVVLQRDPAQPPPAGSSPPRTPAEEVPWLQWWRHFFGGSVLE